MSEEEQPKRRLFGRLFRKGEKASAGEETDGPAAEPRGEMSLPVAAEDAYAGSGGAEEGITSLEGVSLFSAEAAGPAAEDSGPGEPEETDHPRRGLFSRMFTRREEEDVAREGADEVPEGEPVQESAVPAVGEAEPRALRPGVAVPPEPKPAPEESAADPVPAQPVDQGDQPELEPDPEKSRGLFGRLRSGLTKTRKGLVQKVDRVLLGKKEIDADTLEELEEALVGADLGVHTSLRLIAGIQEKVSRKELTSPEALREHLRREIRAILVADEGHFELGTERPQVLMVVGVNGVGKTTTIGKLAAQYRARGHKVLLAAGDTFRAAAVEQLQIWGERAGAQVVRHQDGSDPAAVAFDAVEAAKARGVDLVIVDTAGRLHTKSNLMEELKKVKRVIAKAMPGAPHQVLLVLDATTGQNAINQAKIFREAVDVGGIALTKLDGTAKGGVIVGICDELKIPVQFIGIGEQVDDLRPFDAEEFVAALF